jgi:hypothetical protein
MAHEIKHNLWRDGGNKSRKLWFSVFAIGIMFAALVYATSRSVGEALYNSFVDGVVGIAGLYIVGNIGAKWTASKSQGTAPVGTPQTTPQAPIPVAHKIVADQSQVGPVGHPPQDD